MDSFNVSKDSWVNRHASSSGAFASSAVPTSALAAAAASIQGTTSDSSHVSWRLTRAILKNGTLSFYKPPTDFAIRSFDPNLPPEPSTANSGLVAPPGVVNTSTSTSPASPSPYYNDQGSVMDYNINEQYIPHGPRSSTDAAFPDHMNPSNSTGHPSTPRNNVALASAAALSANLCLNPTVNANHLGSSPHPDLEYDDNGEIIGASLDALCHTILFSNDDKYAQDAFLALPLMTDMVSGFQTLKNYATKNQDNNNDLDDGLLTQMLQRTRMIVHSMVDYFSGMFLEPAIVRALESFISSFAQTDVADLKKIMARTHEKMVHLVEYNGDEYYGNWNAQQDSVDFESDKLRRFFARVEKLAEDSHKHSNTSSGTTKIPGHELSANLYSLITPELFIEMCNSEFLAQQISWFHLRFYEKWSPSSDISLLFRTNIYTYHRLNPLVFDFGDCHFLGTLLIDLVLKQPSTPASRAKIISAWINLGNAFKSYGDIVGWIAIASVLCSVPIFRLRDTWSHVSKELRDCVIKDWGFEIFEVEKRSKIDVLGKKTFRVSTEEMGESYPKERAVPYFGDLFVKNDSNSNNHRGIYGLCFDRLNRVRMVLNGWKYYFDQVPQNDTFGPGPEPIAAVQKMLYQLLNENAYLAPISLDEMMHLSLKVEPDNSCEYLKHHYSQKSPLSTGGFLPLLFTDVNPGYKLFAKPALIAASGILNQGSKRSFRGARGSDSISTIVHSPSIMSGTTMASSTSTYNLSGVDTNSSSSSSGGAFPSFSKYSFKKNVFGGGSSSSAGSGHNSESPFSNENKSTSSLGGTLPASASVGHPASASTAGVAGVGGGGATGLYRSNSFPPAISSSQFTSTTGVKDVDLSSVQFISQLETHNIFMKTIKDVLNVDARMFSVNDDIVLKSFDDEISSINNARDGTGSTSSSRPSSVIEAPSKRLSDTSSRRMSVQLVNNTGSRLSTDFSLIASAFENSNAAKRHNTNAQLPLSINVVVKAANLERLVDILVLGVNEFSSFISKDDIESLQNANTKSIHGLLKRPQFRIDMNIHTLTFFATFRSFCSPLDLVNSLRKRFVGAAKAALSIVECDRKQQISERAGQDDSDPNGDQMDHTSYPNWEPNGVIESDDTIAWRIVAQIQIGVLEACHLWVSQYFSDFMNNYQLRDQFFDLIRIFGSEIALWKEIGATGLDENGDPATINEDYKSYLDSMEVLYKKVRNLFVKKSYRPNDIRPLISNLPAGVRVDNLMVGNNEVTMMRIEKFVDELDTVVNDIYNMMSLHNWMEVFEILELQSVDPTGFFHYNTPTFTSEDDLYIEDIYGFIEILSARERNTSILKLLPQPVQELFRLHKNLVGYFVSQISDPSVQKDDRVARIVTLVKMLAVCRARMSYLDIFDSNIADSSLSGGLSTRVPSFIESAIISSITRPESRCFANSWIQAGRELQNFYEPAKALQQASNSLPNVHELYVPKLTAENLKYERSHRSATPCVGWAIERMLEIVCYVPNMSVERTSLINFDKRRYIYNLVTNIHDFGDSGNSNDDTYPRSRDSTSPEEAATTAMTKEKHILYKKLAHIINPDPRLYSVDRRVVRDIALREAKQYPRNALKNRVFTTYVSQELEKIKRDSRQREILERQGKEPKKSLYKFKGTSSAGSTFNGITGSGQHSHSQSGSILGSSRDRGSIFVPSSNASSSASISERKQGRGSRFGGLLKAVRPISMAFGTTNAPGLSTSSERVISVGELPELSNVHDSRYKILMTLDLAKVSNIEVVDSGTAMRIVLPDSSEYTLQCLNPKDCQEWAQYLLMSQRYSKYRAFIAPDCTKVFGVPLDIVCAREGSVIPLMVETLLTEIEKRGLEEVGLYRVSGSVASINLLKSAFDSSKNVNMNDPRWYDINTVAGCFKLYLRELPEPLLTTSLYQDFIECGKHQITDVHDLGPLYYTMRRLPAANFALLKRLLEHLGLVVDHEEENKMKTPNLAIVFSMSFLPSNGIEFMRATQNLVNTMIVYRQILLGDVPPEMINFEDEDGGVDANEGLYDGEARNTTDEQEEDTESTASSDGGHEYKTASNQEDVYSSMNKQFVSALGQRPTTIIRPNDDLDSSTGSDGGDTEAEVEAEAEAADVHDVSDDQDESDGSVIDEEQQQQHIDEEDPTATGGSEEEPRVASEFVPVGTGTQSKRASTQSQSTQNRDSFTEVSAY